jgi:hypothetical protein
VRGVVAHMPILQNRNCRLRVALQESTITCSIDTPVIFEARRAIRGSAQSSQESDVWGSSGIQQAPILRSVSFFGGSERALPDDSCERRRLRATTESRHGRRGHFPPRGNVEAVRRASWRCRRRLPYHPTATPP